jgi:hypothetical protein
MGETRLPEIRAKFDRRVQSNELIEVKRRSELAATRSRRGRCRSTSARSSSGCERCKVTTTCSPMATGTSESSASEYEPETCSRRWVPYSQYNGYSLTRDLCSFDSTLQEENSMTICSWMAQSEEILMESIGRHAKLHIRYTRRKAVFVGMLVAGNAHPILMLLL